MSENDIDKTEFPFTKLTYIKKYSKEICFLFLVGGSSILIGFSTSLAHIKKKDPHSFNQHISKVQESGEALAMRALKNATVYTTFTFSGLCLLTYIGLSYLKGNNLEEKMKLLFNINKKSRKDEGPKINTMQELMDYILKNDSNGSPKR